MPTMPYIIVTGPPGVEHDKAVTKLAEALDAVHADVELHLKRLPETIQRLRDVKAPEVEYPPNMEHITHYLPRLTVAELWKAAAPAALAELGKSPSAFKFLGLHMVNYSGNRRDFYSAVDAEILRGTTRSLDGQEARLQPERVIVLIDDLYDMYARLTQADCVLSIEAIQDAIEGLAKDRKVDPKSLRHQDLTQLTQAEELWRCLLCLRWRHMEMITTEILAVRLGVTANRMILWPVKQSLEPLLSWLRGDNQLFVYVSHPISGPRDEYRGERKKSPSAVWPRFTTDEMNALPALLSDAGVSVVMPTGIDEYRLGRDGVRYTGLLEPRWPLPAGLNQTLYVEPELTDFLSANGTPPDYDSFFNPRYWDLTASSMVPFVRDRAVLFRDDTELLESGISVPLEMISNELKAEISARDFFEVYHSDGVLVYRPFYGGRAKFSRGVEAEVHLWEDLVRVGDTRRLAIVHFDADVQDAIDAITGSSKDALLNAVCAPLKDILGDNRLFSSEDTLRDLVLHRGTLGRMPSTLVGSRISQKYWYELRKGFPDHFFKARVRLLGRILAGRMQRERLDQKRELLSIWVVSDFARLRTQGFEQICSFFKEGAPNGNDWASHVDDWLPDSRFRKTADP